MQCTQPSLPAAAAARGAYRATNSACPKAEQDPCKAVCNSFPLLPLAYSNSAASSIWYSSSSSIVVQGSLGNFLIIKIESLLLLFLSHFSLQLCFTILFCSLFLFFLSGIAGARRWRAWWQRSLLLLLLLLPKQSKENGRIRQSVSSRSFLLLWLAKFHKTSWKEGKRRCKKKEEKASMAIVKWMGDAAAAYAAANSTKGLLPSSLTVTYLARRWRRRAILPCFGGPLFL